MEYLAMLPANVITAALCCVPPVVGGDGQTRSTQPSESPAPSELATIVEQLRHVASYAKFRVTLTLVVYPLHGLAREHEAALSPLIALAAGGAKSASQRGIREVRSDFEALEFAIRSAGGDEAVWHETLEITTSINAVAQRNVIDERIGHQLRAPYYDLIYDPANDQVSVFLPGNGLRFWDTESLMQPLVITPEYLAAIEDYHWTREVGEPGVILFRFSRPGRTGYGEIALSESGVLLAASSQFSPGFHPTTCFAFAPDPSNSGSALLREGVHVAISGEKLQSYAFVIHEVELASDPRELILAVPPTATIIDFRGGIRHFRANEQDTWPRELADYVELRVGEDGRAIRTDRATGGALVPVGGVQRVTLAPNAALLGYIAMCGLIGVLALVLGVRRGPKTRLRRGLAAAGVAVLVGVGGTVLVLRSGERSAATEAPRGVRTTEHANVDGTLPVRSPTTRRERSARIPGPASGDAPANPVVAERGSIRAVAKFGSGALAAGVVIRIAPSGVSRRTSLEGTTGTGGSVVFEGLRPGRWRVDSQVGDAVECAVEPGVEQSVEVAIPNGVELAGVVIDDSHRPIERAEVWISRSADRIPRAGWARTNERGQFRIDDTGGARFFGAMAAGHAPSAPAVLDGHRANVEITLVRNGVSISGVVVDERNEAVAGALVVVSRSRREEQPGTVAEVTQEQVSDESGSYCFASCPVGDLVLRATAPGYQVASCAVGSRSGEDVRWSPVLRKGGEVRGVVRTAAGVPTGGALVYLGERTDPLCNWTVSLPDGSYALQGLDSGQLLLRADGRDLGRDSIEIYCRDQCSLAWNPALGVGGLIRGVVVDSQGRGIDGVRVIAVSVSDTHQATTSESGAFSMHGCTASMYRVEVRNEANVTVAVEERVEPDGRTRVLKAGETSAYIEGAVFGSDDRPFYGARVVFVAVDGSGAYPASITGHDGAFRSPALVAGSYDVHIDGGRHLLETRRVVDVSSREVRQLDRVTLRPSGSIRVECTARERRELRAELYVEGGAMLAPRVLVADSSPVVTVIERLPLERICIVVFRDGVEIDRVWAMPSNDEGAIVVIGSP
jgi:hypothetical protein